METNRGPFGLIPRLILELILSSFKLGDIAKPCRLFEGDRRVAITGETEHTLTWDTGVDDDQHCSGPCSSDSAIAWSHRCSSPVCV